MNKFIGTDSCGTSLGGLWSICSDSDPGADIKYILNICKRIWFTVYSFLSP